MGLQIKEKHIADRMLDKVNEIDDLELTELFLEYVTWVNTQQEAIMEKVKKYTGR
jgi:hypothetical protein